MPSYAPTYWALIEDAAERLGDHVVLADDYGRTLSAAGLRDEAERAAAGLAALGIGAGSVVSWQIPTVLEAAVLMGALARLDVVQNPIIPILREREVGFITRQVGTNFFITPETWRGFDHGGLARGVGDDVGFSTIGLDLTSPPVPGTIRLPQGDPATLPPPPTSVDRGALVRWYYYSSGTTADPKGARHTDLSIMAAASGMLDLVGFNERDIYPIAWPFSHIGGSTMLTVSLVGGVRLVLFDVFDAATTPERMATHRPTLLGSAVPFFNAFMAAQQRHGDDQLFPDLRACAGGGAPIPAEIHEDLHRTLGVSGVTGSWGLTEFPIATSCTPDDPRDVLTLTVGRASPGVTIRAVLADGTDASLDVEGELVLHGSQQFLGYIDPALDAHAFIDDNWFRTGDLGVVQSDGNIRITGRLKDIIIRNAENISALEVEELLFKHPDVVDAAVIGLPDARTGERVCAVVLLRDGATLTIDALRDHCRALGLAIQKCPEQLEIADAIPRNGMGKTLKQPLVATYRDR
jgi:acyl-CoA synthetase (AMP-forming)/AMP-acid ligase II